MRFCSRCGFQLGGVTALLSGGAAPQETISTSSVGKQRGRRTRQGAKLMFLSAVLLPIAFGFSILTDSPIPLLLPLTVFLAGLAWFLYFRMFEEETQSITGAHAPAQVAAPRQSFLHDAQSVPATDLHSTSPRTAEIVRPPSVTEHTTKLLDDK